MGPGFFIINGSPTTVSAYLARAKLAGLSHPLPADTDGAEPDPCSRGRRRIAPSDIADQVVERQIQRSPNV